MGKIKSIGMAEARPKLTQLVEEVYAGGEPCLIISGSRVKAVIIGIGRYNGMVGRLEDLSDAVELLRAELGLEPTMSFEEHLSKSKELKGGVLAWDQPWVCPLKKDAMYYGIAERFHIPNGTMIIGEDEQGGYMMLLPER